MSEVLTIDPHIPPDAVISRLCQCLQSGGLVVAPTDTRYGLLVRADRKEAVERLLAVKRRQDLHPVSVMVKDKATIARLGKTTELAQQLRDAFLPGPLTLVLTATVDWTAPMVVAGRIGIRWIALPLIQRVLDHLEFPLSATSANRSDCPEHDTVDEIRNEFGDEIDVYIEAGSLTGPVSTVVDCTGEEPIILREGAISTAAVRRAARTLI